MELTMSPKCIKLSAGGAWAVVNLRDRALQTNNYMQVESRPTATNNGPMVRNHRVTNIVLSR